MFLDWTIKDKFEIENSLFRTAESITRRKSRMNVVVGAIRRLLFQEWAAEPTHHPIPLLRHEIHQRLNQDPEISPVSVEVMWNCLDFLLGCGYIGYHQTSEQVSYGHIGYVFQLTDEEEKGESMYYIEVEPNKDLIL